MRCGSWVSSDRIGRVADAPSDVLTREVEQLLLVDRPARDWAWRQRFFAAVGGAALVTDDPAVAGGPDGFGYTQFRLPPIGAPYTAYSIDHLLVWSTDQGVGSVLRDRSGEVAWVFTFGNLWARLSAGSFDPSPAGDDQQPSVVGPEGEQVLFGSPSEGLFPPVARQVVRDALLRLGVVDPMVGAVNRQSGHPAWSLALSLPADDAAAHRMTWYLPPQMGMLRIEVVPPEHRVPL